MATVLASAPEECCTSKAFQHSGTPRGSTITLAGLHSYISRPKDNTNKIVLFFPDVYGPFFVNNQLIMDYFAVNGYLVVAPDYFEGDPVHVARTRPDFERLSWIMPNLERAKITVPKWVEAVVKEFGSEKIHYATVGYCFGASFVLDLCATDKVVAGAIAHPAFLNEDHFRKITRPLFLSCAEVDHTFPAESRYHSEEILAGIKATYHYQLFSGVAHGFALRGNMEVENERWAKEESAKGIVSWWNRFMD